MSDLPFTWDPRKAALNLRKHGISFSEAVTAFEDERGILLEEQLHLHGEERFVLLGLSADTRLLVVVHCYRTAGSAIRIISARRATRSEQDLYHTR